jgi:hypothetical protein
MKRRNVVLLVLFLLLAGMQLYRPSIENPDFEVQKDYLAMRGGGDQIKALVKEACYDCHSYETRKPWYAAVAPVSWLLADHVNEGREHLNFSIWGDYGAGKKEHKLEECVEVIEEGEMPFKGYGLTHPKARLTDGQREDLMRYFSGMML